MRDTIAHCSLSDFDWEKCEKMIKGDAFMILTDLEGEKIVDLHSLAGDRFDDLLLTAIFQSDNVEKRVKDILEFHSSRYQDKIKKNPEFARDLKERYEQARFKMGKALLLGDFTTSCPACDNTAEVSTEVEYDWCDHQAVPSGVFVTRIQCQFCGLDIKDYDELQQMGVTLENSVRDQGEDWV